MPYPHMTPKRKGPVLRQKNSITVSAYKLEGRENVKKYKKAKKINHLKMKNQKVKLRIK